MGRERRPPSALAGFSPGRCTSTSLAARQHDRLAARSGFDHRKVPLLLPSPHQLRQPALASPRAQAMPMNWYTAYVARVAGTRTQVRRYVYAWLGFMPVLWVILWLDFGQVGVLAAATLLVYTPLFFLAVVPLSARYSSRR